MEEQRRKVADDQWERLEPDPVQVWTLPERQAIALLLQDAVAFPGAARTRWDREGNQC
jgi:hypothetical protein